MNLRKLLAERRLTAIAASAKAQVGMTAVSDILNGKSASPSIRIVKAIAAALECKVGDLIGEDTDAPTRQWPLIERRGGLETGVFYERNMHKPKKITLLDYPQHPQYPKGRLFEYTVEDESMNAAAPVPLRRGMQLLCIDMVSAGAKVENGKFYVIHTVRTNGDVHHEQRIVRRVTFNKNSTILSPLTSDPGFKTITIKGKLTTNPNEPYYAVGLVWRGIFGLDD